MHGSSVLQPTIYSEHKDSKSSFPGCGVGSLSLHWPHWSIGEPDLWIGKDRGTWNKNLSRHLKQSKKRSRTRRFVPMARLIHTWQDYYRIQIPLIISSFRQSYMQLAHSIVRTGPDDPGGSPRKIIASFRPAGHWDTGFHTERATRFGVAPDGTQTAHSG